MRTLPAGLLSAQKNLFTDGLPAGPIWKVVLSLPGETTRGYSINDRLLVIDHVEGELQNANLLLDNSDGSLTALDFEQFKGILSYGYHTGIVRSIWVASTVYAVNDIRTPTTLNGFQYRCVTAGTSDSSEPTFPTDLGVTVTEGGGSTVVWEHDGNTGDEYDKTAPLYAIDIPLVSSVTGNLVVGLTMEGLLNRMARDKAVINFSEFSGSVQTVKDLITSICDTTIRFSTVYGDYPVVEVVFDSEDALFDTFVPKELLNIQFNDTRYDIIRRLLAFTGTKMRAEADGKLHFFDPTTSGAVFDYEYQLLVDGQHTFLDKEVRNRFVDPNKVVVRSNPSHLSQFTGSATSATSFALYASIKTIQGRFQSNAECANIAAAVIESGELDAQRGSGKFTMNVGQEQWDWVKITDVRQGDSVTGNVRNIHRRCRIGRPGQNAYEMSFGFGKEARGPSASALLSNIPQTDIGTQIDPTAFVTWPFMTVLQQRLNEAFQAAQFATDVLDATVDNLRLEVQALRDGNADNREELTVQVLNVEQRYTGPVEAA